GGIVGEISLLDGSPSTARVVARTRARALHLPHAVFRELLRQGDLLAIRCVLALGALVARRTRDAQARLLGVESPAAAAPPGAGTSRRRIASVRDAALAATLSDAEIDRFASWGRELEETRLAMIGQPADRIFLVLAGGVDLVDASGAVHESA